MSEFMFMHGHASITFDNGYRISMTNYDNAHCHHHLNRSDKYVTYSSDAEVMIFDPHGNDITKLFYSDASPDVSNITPNEIVCIMKQLILFDGTFKKDVCE